MTSFLDSLHVIEFIYGFFMLSTFISIELIKRNKDSKWRKLLCLLVCGVGITISLVYLFKTFYLITR